MNSPSASGAVPARILLVDDLEENLLALSALLRREGAELCLATSADEALELLLAHDFAVALIDVYMPGTDGFELAELMRSTERCKHIPIIFTTAGPRDPRRVFEGYDLGAVDFLFKPLEPRILRHKVAVFLDLDAHRRQLAAEVEKRERLLREMRETLRLNETFTAVLGHDLRTPLGAIVAGAALLEDGTSGAVAAAVGRRITSSAARMSHMIDQLLDLARARLSGGIPVHPTSMRFLACMRKIATEVTACRPEREIILESVGDDVGSWDEERLSQVLANLLSNALQHGARDRPITARFDGTDLDRVRASIHNEGHIEATRLPGLFDPFHGSADKESRAGGLGLGLYIVAQIVRSHGGEIRVESTPARGTTFEIVLPRYSA